MYYLVVDDEYLARARLHELITRIDPLANVIEAENGEDAIHQFEDHHPDLVLVDIRMPGISGMELAYHLSSVEKPPAVIFTTAHNEYALQAFDVNAIDYLLKPIRMDRLQQALSKAEPLTARQNQILVAGEERRTHIAVREANRIQLIPLQKIGFFKADSKYTAVRTKDATYIISETLNKLESDLGDSFIRAHRNSLVSTHYFAGIEKSFEDRYQVFLHEFDERLDVSRRQKPVILRWMKNRYER